MCGPPATAWPRALGSWRCRRRRRGTGRPTRRPPGWGRWPRPPLGPAGADHPGAAPERLPVGLLAQQVGARDPATIGQRTTRQQRPIAAQERQTGLTRVAAVREAPTRGPQTDVVCIGDREAAGYDRCLQERPAGVDVWGRAAWNRRVDHPERSLWTTVAAPPVVATLTVGVPRRGRPPARQATVAGRWCLVWWGPPTHRTAETRPSMAVWAVQAVEEQPPAGGDPSEGRLLTPGAGPTPAAAVARVDG